MSSSGTAGRRLFLVRLFLVLALGWIALIAALYAKRLVLDLPPDRLRGLWAGTRDFFVGQAAGSLLVLVLAALLRPSLAGRLCAGYLGASTLVLLALSRDPSLAVSFAAFLVWVLLATGSVRLVLGRFAGTEQGTWGLAAGVLYAALVPMSFLLSLCGLMSRWPVAAAALALAAPGAARLLRSWRAGGRAVVRRLDRLGPVGATALAAAWIALALAFVWACTPETESDAMRTHLPYMQQLVRDGGLSVAPLDFQRLMIYGTRALFATGLAAGSLDVARWLSWFCAVALMALVGEEVARRSGNPDLGALAGAAVVTTPMLLWLSRTLYHDHVITLLCTTAFVALFRSFAGGGSRSGALVSAFVLGCAAQTKYSVLLFALVWVACLALWALRELRPAAAARWCLAPLAVLALAACPWYLETWATIGNPVFPYLNGLFGSAHWPQDMPTSFDFASFTFGEGVDKKLLFPWYATFQSSRIDQSPDGRLGFLFLALLPFALVCRRRHAAALGAAGVAGFLILCLRTPYARYWFPMVPLTMIPLLLAFGESVSRARWRWPKWSSPLVCTVLFGVLLVSLPVFATERFGFPWKVYRQEVSESAWMATTFAGFSAVERVNALLRPGDRLVVTGYEAVYTLNAEAYALPFWFLRIHGVGGPASFADLLAAKKIRYWVMDHSSRESVFFAGQVGGAAYWDLSRLVAGSSTLAVYDVASPAGESRRVVVEERAILPSVEAGPPAADGSGWQDVHRDDPGRAARPGGGALEVPAGGQVAYDVSVPAGAQSCQVVMERVRGTQEGVVVFSLAWLDPAGRVLGRVGGNASLPRGQRTVYFFAEVPAGAVAGRLLAQPWQAVGVELGATKLEFSRLRDAPGGSPAEAPPPALPPPAPAGSR